MKITDAIALEHATLLRVFDQVERVLPPFTRAALSTFVQVSGLIDTRPNG
jgi:hypothetical protein